MFLGLGNEGDGGVESLESSAMSLYSTASTLCISLSLSKFN